MDDLDIDLDAVARLPRRLWATADGVRRHAGLPVADTGASSERTAAALADLRMLTDALVGDVDRLADGVRESVDAYEATDGDVSWFWATRIEAALS